MNEKIAEKISLYLMDGKEDRLVFVKLKYFFEMLISELEKSIIIITFFSVLGYWIEILIVFLILLLIRRYCGGNHCKSFLGCLGVSFLFCMAAIYGGRYFMLNTLWYITINVIHVFMIVFAIPIKSKIRPKLFDRDIIKIRLNALIGLVIINSIVYVGTNQIKEVAIMTLLLLLIDELIAGVRNGFTRLRDNSCI